MESQRSHHILTRLTKIRRRPQQPLTDFTELYSRIANETIYYLNLEEKKRYKEALQGWKALTTDVLFKHTLIIAHLSQGLLNHLLYSKWFPEE